MCSSLQPVPHANCSSLQVQLAPTQSTKMQGNAQAWCRVVPRAFRVYAQGAVYLQVVCAFRFYNSAVRAFLAGGLAPKAQNRAKYCAAARNRPLSRTEGKHAGQPQPRAGLHRNVFRFLKYDCNLHEERQMWNDDDVVAW
jgi:hypothetical protein